MRPARIQGAASLFGLALLLQGCAAITPELKPQSTAPASGAPAAAATSAVPAAPAHVANATAGTDSLPSPDAERVLASIPEPLTAAERVPPPDAPGVDSSRVHPDSVRAGVPVPAETAPLGQSPADVQRMTSPDSALGGSVSGSAIGSGASPAGASSGAAGTGAAAGAATTAAAANANSTPSSSAGATTGMAPGAPCFKLQVGAPKDAKQADGLKRAAASQLELDFEIVHVKNLYKVRSHDCFSREAVDALRARATAAGFQGVFAVATSAK